ncbi:MAG: cobyrinate a,c-diamide synthase [Alicyclobacillus sp.]|nr:cobyrinate a,c-diamide synthase [Alicyclobacillus sp.]
MSAADRPRLVVAGVHSGAGKTTLTLGLLAALARQGIRVQAFKAGPDYIDPSFHTVATGRTARNLDTWMMPAAAVQEVFWRATADADMALVEGVMGLFDGQDPFSNRGSTAELSLFLQAPVLLVLDARSMARSAAAVVKGFQVLDPAVRLAGVIANRVGSSSHLELIRAAVEDACGIPVLGGLPRQPELTLPERHLGLVPAVEHTALNRMLDDLAAAVTAAVDVPRVVALARSAPPLPEPDAQLFAGQAQPPRAVIAVAQDEAFHFYYPENLELLAWCGAQLRPFRPLHGEPVPADADGLYLGGGFPEQFAAQLSAQRAALASIRTSVQAGMPTLAECGGLMLLAEELVDRQGNVYPLAGVLPLRVRMQERRAALGYREAEALTPSFLLAAGERVRGHEYHYSTAEWRAELPPAYRVTSRRGAAQEGVVCGNLVAGYTHIHFASNPAAAQRWVNACANYRQRRVQGRTLTAGRDQEGGKA